jgi:AraC family transcriptional regulator of adaptative response/methylated-DNA-[protein]-cysteine methyltransferase
VNAQSTLDHWKAVLTKDTAADGLFVFAVKTTGIYCRPSCPSRLPLRENIVYFKDPDSAELEGYRPCKRCNPRLETLQQQQARMVAQSCRLLDSSPEGISLARLSERFAMSPFHFHRIFRALTGVTPKQYSQAVKQRLLQHELRKDKSITQAFYDSGFSSSGHFYESAGEMLGMKPSLIRKGGRQLKISFAIGSCSLGTVLVATTERGICAIYLGDEPAALQTELIRDFPTAEVVQGGEELNQRLTQVVNFVDKPGTGLSLPLDIQGTIFQQRVWKVLQGIPVGTTATYSQVASMMDEPGAVRAVASACAANKVAVAIPCHRVVRSDSSLAGYRWGVERKQSLLRLEAHSIKSESQS